MIPDIINALNLVFTPEMILIIIFGIILGSIFGALPGLGGSVAMAILLPLTIILDGTQALVLFITIYNGAMYGGSISAILLNVPGTAGAAATTFDGYPLTRMGRSGEALTISAISSSLGGLIASCLAILIIPLIIPLILVLTRADYFLIALLGISMIAFVTEGRIIKGIIAGSFGLLLTTVGIAPAVPDLRYTFGLFELYDGLSFVAMLIGVFAISEMLKLIMEGGSISKAGDAEKGYRNRGIITAVTNPISTIKSSIIGLLVGMVPGAGGSVANFIAYTEQARSDAGPHQSTEYGEGNTKGVIAAEAANNGNVSGGVLPTISFGLPGSGAQALLLAGMIFHGFTPGPTMLRDNIVTTYSLFIALMVSAIVIGTFGILVVSKANLITLIDVNYIIPFVVILSAFGSYALRVNYIDVVTIGIFGIIGFILMEYNYSVIAFVLGAVLGSIAERNFLQALQISDGSYNVFVQSTTSKIIWILIVLVLLGPKIKTRIVTLDNWYRKS